MRFDVGLNRKHEVEMISKNGLKNEQLMVAYQCGDNESLDILFARNRRQLMSFAMKQIPASRAGRKQLAEDAVQNAFVKVVCSRKRTSCWQPDKASVMSWLFMLVRHQVKSMLRKKSGSEKVCSDYETDSEACHSVEHLKLIPNSNPFEFDRILQSLISALPSEVREVVVLTLEGLSCKEIATTLKVSLPTISRRFQVARQIIAEMSFGLAA